jgi:hypothetical protein
MSIATRSAPRKVRKSQTVSSPVWSREFDPRPEERAMTAVERIELTQAKIEHIQEGLERIQTGLGRAEDLTLAAQQATRTARRVSGYTIAAALGIATVIILVVVVRRRRATQGDDVSDEKG